jgi:hypothetical protein
LARRALRRVDAAWYAPAPALRLALVRALVGAYACFYLVLRAPGLTSVARFSPADFAPVGPVSILHAPLPQPAVYVLWALALAFAVPFALGIRYRLTAPIFALLLLWVTSYRNSWGMKFHTENLLTLHVLLLAAAPAGDVLSPARRRARAESEPSGRYGWALSAMCAVTVATYVLAGVAKLRNSGAEWLGGEALRAHIAYDNVRKMELGSTYSPLAAALVPHGELLRPLAWLTLAIELGAPLALLGRAPAKIWVALAFSFHLGVVALMMIAFPYPLSGIAYLSFFPVDRVAQWRPLRRWLLES